MKIRPLKSLEDAETNFALALKAFSVGLATVSNEKGDLPPFVVAGTEKAKIYAEALETINNRLDPSLWPQRTSPCFRYSSEKGKFILHTQYGSYLFSGADRVLSRFTKTNDVTAGPVPGQLFLRCETGGGSSHYNHSDGRRKKGHLRRRRPPNQLID